MDLTITIFSTHIIHEVNMREVVLVDFFYKLSDGFFIGFSLGHVLILQCQGQKVNLRNKIPGKISCDLNHTPEKISPLGAPFTLAIRTGLEPVTSTVTG